MYILICEGDVAFVSCTNMGKLAPDVCAVNVPVVLTLIGVPEAPIAPPKATKVTLGAVTFELLLLKLVVDTSCAVLPPPVAVTVPTAKFPMLEK